MGEGKEMNRIVSDLRNADDKTLQQVLDLLSATRDMVARREVRSVTIEWTADIIPMSRHGMWTEYEQGDKHLKVEIDNGE